MAVHLSQDGCISGSETDHLLEKQVNNFFCYFELHASIYTQNRIKSGESMRKSQNHYAGEEKSRGREEQECILCDSIYIKF